MKISLLPLLLIGLVATTACSQPGGEGRGDAAASVEEKADAVAAPVRTVPQDSHAKPDVADLKTFKDWAVGCDNTNRCTMVSLGEEFSADFPKVTLEIMREAGPDGALTLKVYRQSDEITPASLRADNGAQASIRDGAVDNAEAFARQLVNAQWLDALDAEERPLQRISLSGLSASLRYMDAVQGRADGVTAIVARGAKPASAVPVAPALPTVVALEPGNKVSEPTPAMVAEMRDLAHCETDSVVGQMAAASGALGDGTTLVLVPCSAGAYNLWSALFLLRDGEIVPAELDAATDMQQEQSRIRAALNAVWKDGMLKTFSKGRGLGDCGVLQSFVWDGRTFRLVEQSVMGECRGNPNYITVWRAQVVRTQQRQ